MLTGITLGQYFPGTSLIHRVDPRSKIVLVLLLLSSVFLAESNLSYACITVFFVTLLAVAGIPVLFILKAIKPLWFIILLTFCVHIFSTPGHILYQFSIFTATTEGIRMGLLMSLRLVLLIVVSSLLTFTTTPMALTDGIERLLKPFQVVGLPAHELAMMMTIALRFIPTLLEETQRIMQAQSARGADFSSGNIVKRAKNMIPLLVPLFVSAFRRADDLATAMEARCYRGGKNRTRMTELRYTVLDGLAGLIVLAFLGFLALLRFGGLNKVWS